MSNTYYKVLNQTLKTRYADNFIGNIQRDLTRSVKLLNENLYDEIRNASKADDVDINTLLKYYAINQLLKDTKTSNLPPPKEENGDLKRTANPNIRKNVKDDKFYKLAENDEYVLDEKIRKVYDDGTYEREARMSFSAYVLKRLYTPDDIVCAMQLISPSGAIEGNKYHAVEILGLRKEFVQKFKYSGYSGNSTDIFAAIGNKVCAPIESGYYIDKHFHFYRWSENQKMFIRNTKLELFSPLLTDYIFESGKVIRKEYNGAV